VGEYREVRPSARLRKHVECFWFLQPTPGETNHRVLPDGCTDLVFSIVDGRVRGSAAGTMTRAALTSVAPGEQFFGVRFHPGMSHGLLRVPVGTLTDAAIDLASLWGKEGRELDQRLSDAGSNEARIHEVERAIEPPDIDTPVQRAALWIVKQGGNAEAGDIARHVGLSARQFRRLCIEQTGIGPKMLCRTVRFRNAVNDLPRYLSNGAEFALDHGYYDQAHFINEFREFSGVTPVEYMTVFSNTPERAGP